VPADRSLLWVKERFRAMKIERHLALNGQSKDVLMLPQPTTERTPRKLHKGY
jgi:hypothetical protein